MIFYLILTVLLVLIIYSWLDVLNDSKRLNIPGPFPVPVFGNGLWLLGDPTSSLQFLENMVQKFGGVIRFYVFNQRYMVVTDLKWLEAITTSTELIVKGRAYNFLHLWLGQGLLTSTGRRWKTHRKFLTPAFHFNILQNFLPVFLKNEKILINKLKTRGIGSDIDLFPVIALAALDNVTESIMGKCINSQLDSESEYVKAVGKLSEIISYRLRNPFATVEAIFNLMPVKKEQDEAIAVLHKCSRRVIETRRRELEQNDGLKTIDYDYEHGIKNKHAFLDLLLLGEIDGQKMDDESIREEVDTFMFEGHDTITSGLVFSLYCLSKHRDVQEKIFEEQQAILGDDMNRDPTYSELHQMKYLDLAIKESLRLYPPVAAIERHIRHDTEIAGTFVPKDTSILLDIIHMQRDPAVYENPKEFQPERFENTNGKNPFTWLPFSAGPRNCIGQKFALLEMRVFLSAIIRSFVILPSKQEPVLCLDLILRSRNGVFVQLKPRPLKHNVPTCTS